MHRLKVESSTAELKFDYSGLLSLALQQSERDKNTSGVALPQSRTLGLDTVSTGSGSDLVSDQHALFSKILDSYRLTRSLPLPVLTVSKNDF
jgi:hypothetical protein